MHDHSEDCSLSEKNDTKEYVEPSEIDYLDKIMQESDGNLFFVIYIFIKSSNQIVQFYA